MLSIVAILSLLCFCEARQSSRPDAAVNSRPRLIGGTNAVRENWKAVVEVQTLQGLTEWNHVCAGILLCGRYALTAGHCVEGIRSENIRIIAGMYQLSNTTGTLTSYIDSYTIHEGYNDGTSTFANDIAVLSLANWIQYGEYIDYARIPPDNNDTFAGDNCMISGWGRISNDYEYPDALQEAGVNVMTTTDCQGAMQPEATYITDKHLCVKSQLDVAICYGDGGGPVNCRDGTGGLYSVGLASFSINEVYGDCLVAYPSVYTRLGSYASWITTNTPGECQRPQ